MKLRTLKLEYNCHSENWVCQQANLQFCLDECKKHLDFEPFLAGCGRLPNSLVGWIEIHDTPGPDRLKFTVSLDDIHVFVDGIYVGFVNRTDRFFHRLIKKHGPLYIRVYIEV